MRTRKGENWIWGGCGWDISSRPTVPQSRQGPHCLVDDRVTLDLVRDRIAYENRLIAEAIDSILHQICQ